MGKFLLSPLGFKIAAGIVIVLAGFGLLRLYGNAQYYKGREDEKQSASEQSRKEADKARDAARAELQKEREQVASDRASLAASRAQFQQDRQRLDVQMRDRLAAIAAASKGDTNRVLETPDAGLSDLVRMLNSELRQPAEPTTQPR